MMKRQRLAAILAALMLLPTLAACSGNDGPAEDSTSTSTSASDTSAPVSSAEDTTPVDPEPTLAFEKEDNGNRTFNILTDSANSFEYLDEGKSDRVSSAVADRNRNVEEYLGIKLNIIQEDGTWKNRNQYKTIIQQNAIAGDSAYDYITGMLSIIVPTFSSDYNTNLLEIPYLDLSNSWWVSSMAEETAVNGKLYGVFGDVSLSVYKQMSVLFVNLDLVENKNLENPYELVSSGKWTWDKFMEQTAGAGEDVNGDGVYELGTDVLGALLEANVWRSMNAAFDIHTAEVKDGEIVINDIDDRFMNAFNSMTNYLASNSDCNFYRAQDQACIDAFGESKAVYAMLKLTYAETYADMEDDFGIIPMAKLDEDQENYRSLIATASEIIAVPRQVKDLNLVGKTLEALSFFSDDVVTEYYDTAMKDRYSRDPETAKMLDIIRDTSVMSADYFFSTTLGGKVQVHITLGNDNTEGYQPASYFAESMSTWKQNIKTLMEAYADPQG